MTNLNFEDWQRFTVALGRAGGSPVGFRLNASESTRMDRGTVYVDQMTATYDNTTDDTPPEISISLNETEWQVRATVRDAVDGVLPAGAVSVYYNGQTVTHQYDEATGYASFSLPGMGESQPPMRVTVEAKDASGNIARASVDVPPYNQEHLFTDIEGHWAADYIDYLGSRNIADPGGDYRPYDAITRVEFAVMLARASGYDGRLYESVELPYADLDRIPDYALPALRALWAENVMRGAEGADGELYLMPDDGLTRAQASAMIGRSQKLGFAAGSLQRFPDADEIPEYARSHIQTMAAREILQGFQDGTFRPQESITRGQMAKILYFLA